MASAASQAIRRTVTAVWPKHQEAGAKAHLLRVARDGHAGIMRRQGNPAFEAYANRPGNTNLESVVLPGPIVYTYSTIRSVVEAALDALERASPVDSGDYARSHTVFVNGVAVDVLPASIKPSDEVMIVNPMPYARRLEIGKTESGRDFLISVPNRIYERVAKNVLIPRYRNSAKITFTYVTVPEAYRYKRDNAARSWLANKKRWYVRPKQRQDRVKGAVVQSPAILISQLS